MSCNICVQAFRMDFLHTHPKKNAVEREINCRIFSDLDLGRKKMLKIRQIDEHVQTVKDLEGEPGRR